MSLLMDVATHRNELKTDSYTTTISDLLATYARGDLKIDPDYQRLFRWDLSRQTEYIESLLLNIPTPPMFFANNSDGTAEVIDGLQRLSTLLKFFAEEVFEEVTYATPENVEIESNNIRVGALLSAGPLIPSLSGCTLRSMPESLARSLRYSRVPIILLEKESSPRARFHVFRRLNRSGARLSEQEIRNCSARLIGASFADRLRRIAELPEVKASLRLSAKQAMAMGGEEAVLRILANAHRRNEFSHSVVEFLDDFMEYGSGASFDTEAAEHRIRGAFSLIGEAFPNGEAFRFWKKGRASGAFSPNLLDVVGTGIYCNYSTLVGRVDFLRSVVPNLLGSAEVRNLTGAGSNTKRKHIQRVELGIAAFSPTDLS